MDKKIWLYIVWCIGCERWLSFKNNNMLVVFCDVLGYVKLI